ncbi:hypothetical protein, partial [Klebsiella pneumoniae]|uniref:hypothetical protein n=1 Tax=Klebsiella pneumoniae TaxID=573 RepID=UPI0025A03DD0
IVMVALFRVEEEEIDLVVEHLPYHDQEVPDPHLLGSGQDNMLVGEFIGEDLDASPRGIEDVDILPQLLSVAVPL